MRRTCLTIGWRWPLIAVAGSVSACTESTRPTDQPAALVEFRASAPTYIARITVVFSGPGITDSLLFDLPVVAGAVFDTFELQAGGERSITVNAYDSSNVNTHRGDTTVTLQPGPNPPLRLVLAPLSGTLPMEVDFGSPTDWTFQVDLKPVSVSFGMGIGLMLFDSAVGLAASRAQGKLIEIHHTGSDLPLFYVADAAGNVYRSTPPALGSWYTIRLSYMASTNTADILITNTATGAEFYRQGAVAFASTSFNSVGFGAVTAAGDGTTAEMHYDNLSVSRGGAPRCSQDFAVEPTLTFTSPPAAGDSYTWDSTLLVYKVQLAETVPSTDKYAVAALC